MRSATTPPPRWRWCRSASSSYPGPITTKGTNRIDRVARWYLQKIAHDLGAIYLFHDIGDVTGCDRYAAGAAVVAGVGDAGDRGRLPGSAGCQRHHQQHRQGAQEARRRRLRRARPHAHAAAAGRSCRRPAPSSSTSTSSRASTRHGSPSARATSRPRPTVTITVGGGGLPPPPGGPSDNDADAFEGFGSTTPGGEPAGASSAVTQATEAAVRDAFTAASDGHAIIRFDTVEPIAIHELAASPHRQLHHGRGQRRDAVRARPADSPT